MIEINNLTKIRVNAASLKQTAEQVLRKEKKSLFDLSIALVDQKEIKELNRKYRRKNKPTDVLSFVGKESKFIQPGQELGEIIICPDVVRKNSEKFRVSFQKEINRVLIHGILHLLGYDHEFSEKDARIMEKKEEYYLKS